MESKELKSAQRRAKAIDNYPRAGHDYAGEGEVMDYEKIADSVVSPETGAPAVEERVIDPSEAFAATKKEYRVSDPRYQGLAEEKGYDQSNSKSRLQSLRYTHEAMIDVILANPSIQQNELATTFDRSVPWISRIIGSDSFQAALAKRREEVTDPFLIATVEERMRGLAFQSLDIITEKLEKSKNVDLALKGLDIAAKSLGFGARGAGAGQTNQFIIQLPPKSADSASWADQHGPMKQVGAA